MSKTFVIGSRGSNLALWQARWIESKLREAGHEARIEIIRTSGDKIRDVALAQVGEKAGVGKGVFTKEIEDALAEGRIDLAVHSLKDLPTELPEGLTLAAVPERADPRDALVGKTLEQLQPGHRVGASSLRRAALLRHLRPGVEMLDIRGNVETRLGKLDAGDYDAILLAVAGLERLGLGERIAERLDPGLFYPAIGQGALGVEIRADDPETAAAVAAVEHAPTRAATDAERAVLDGLGGGCQFPLGGLARVEGDTLHLATAVVAADGGRVVRAHLEGPASEAEALGRRAADTLLEGGAAALIEHAV